MKTDVLWQSDLPLMPNPCSEAEIALLQAPSLTVALRDVHADFSVSLQHLGASELWPDEVGMFAQTVPVLSREVALQLQGQAVVWARSVCPAQAQSWCEVLDCGTRPLGLRLFDGSLPISRSPFEYARLPADHPVCQAYGADLMARRSVFVWDGSPLLLLECFLPALKAYV